MTGGRDSGKYSPNRPRLSLQLLRKQPKPGGPRGLARARIEAEEMTGPRHRCQRRMQEQQRSRRLPRVSAIPSHGHPKCGFPIGTAKLKDALVHVLTPKPVTLQGRPLFIGGPFRLAAHEEVLSLKLMKEIEKERCLDAPQRLPGMPAAGRFDQERDEKARIKIGSYGTSSASVRRLFPSSRVVPGSRGSQGASRAVSPRRFAAPFPAAGAFFQAAPGPCEAWLAVTFFIADKLPQERKRVNTRFPSRFRGSHRSIRLLRPKAANDAPSPRGRRLG